jgi:hypothetical protein
MEPNPALATAHLTEESPMTDRQYREWQWNLGSAHHMWAGPDWWACMCGDGGDDLIGPEVATQTAAHPGDVVAVHCPGRLATAVPTGDVTYAGIHEWLWLNPQYQ